MKEEKLGIIGGGAAGMLAALAAGREGVRAMVLEKKERIGKKILATGNGKCNFSNTDFYEGCYHSGDLEKVRQVLEQFSPKDTRLFLEELGLRVKEKNGGLYPECEQASAVLDVLRFALKYQGVSVKCDCRVTAIEPQKNKGFLVRFQEADGTAGCCRFEKLILSCGTPAGLRPKTEEDGLDGLRLGKLLGAKGQDFFPALVQLRCREPFFKALAGVRCQARVQLLAGGERVCEEVGELQLTDYGISGIPVFQLSRHASRILRTEKRVFAQLDFLPALSKRDWEQQLQERFGRQGAYRAEEFFAGTLPKKVCQVLMKEAHIAPTESIAAAGREGISRFARLSKEFEVTVTAANPFANAQVCAGGILLSEVDEGLQSRRTPGLYYAGELLDVDGRCGGYNLQWAWSSGYVAGQQAARALLAENS